MKLPSVIRKPLVGKGLPAKQPALSLMKEKSPIWQIGLDALACRRTRPDGNSLKRSNLPHGGR